MVEIPKYSAGESQDLAYAIIRLFRINNRGQVHSNVLQLTLDQFATWKTNGENWEVDPEERDFSKDDLDSLRRL